MTNPKKFDPARAHVLDAPEREVFLPTRTLIEALALRGDERVVDYGAGTGRVALALTGALAGDGVLAVEENEQMHEHLSAAIFGSIVQPLLVSGNAVPLPDIPDAVDASRPVAVICGSGQRSAVAASLLAALGR